MGWSILPATCTELDIQVHAVGPLVVDGHGRQCFARLLLSRHAGFVCALVVGILFDLLRWSFHNSNHSPSGQVSGPWSSIWRSGGTYTYLRFTCYASTNAAQIWCWVDRQWDDVRIYTYYMLIWICIVGSLLCYALVGYHVFRSRDRLRSLTASTSREGAIIEMVSHLDWTSYKWLTYQTPNDENDGCYGTVVTEVQVTSSTGAPQSPVAAGKQPQLPEIDTQPRQISVFEHSPTHVPSGFGHYFSSVESPSRGHRKAPSPLKRVVTSAMSAARRFAVADPIKRAYLRTSFLFAISVLVTWIPSSMNRIHSWIDGQSPYEYHVATAAVLPLQGLWNAIIFFVTSWNVLQRHRRNTAASAAAAEAIERLRQDSANQNSRASCGGAEARRYGGFPSETDLGDGDSRTISSEIELQRRSKSQGTSTPPVL